MVVSAELYDLGLIVDTLLCLGVVDRSLRAHDADFALFGVVGVAWTGSALAVIDDGLAAGTLFAGLSDLVEESIG